MMPDWFYRFGHFLVCCVAVITLPFFLCVYLYERITGKALVP